MSTNQNLPTVTRLIIALGSVFFNEANNVRGDWEYDTDPNAKFKDGGNGGGVAGLYEDMEKFGLRKALVVVRLTEQERLSIYAKTGVWYDWECLQGHRRGRCLKQLVLKYPDRFSMIEVDAYEPMTESQKIDVLVDQAHVKGLSDWGWYLAIKKLMLGGVSEADIMRKLGKTRGFVQNRTRIVKLPAIVEDAYRAKCEGTEGVKMTDKHVVSLFAAMGEDEKAGTWNNDSNSGPAFSELWDKVEKEIVPNPKKSRTRKEMLDLSKAYKDPIIKGVLLWCAGETDDLSPTATAMDVLRGKLQGFLEGRTDGKPVLTNDPTPDEEAIADEVVADDVVNEDSPEPSAIDMVNEGSPEPSAPEPEIMGNEPSVPFETQPVGVKSKRKQA